MVTSVNTSEAKELTSIGRCTYLSISTRVTDSGAVSGKGYSYSTGVAHTSGVPYYPLFCSYIVRRTEDTATVAASTESRFSIGRASVTVAEDDMVGCDCSGGTGIKPVNGDHVSEISMIIGTSAYYTYLFTATLQGSSANDISVSSY